MRRRRRPSRGTPGARRAAARRRSPPASTGGWAPWSRTPGGVTLLRRAVPWPAGRNSCAGAAAHGDQAPADGPVRRLGDRPGGHPCRRRGVRRRADNIGVDLLGRYVVVTTSGSTGVPTLLVQDRRAIAVMTGLAYARTGGLLTPRLVARHLRRGGRQAAVFATGGHFLTITMFERRQRALRLPRRWRVSSPCGPAATDRGRAERVPAGAARVVPELLALLAEEQQAGRLRLSPVADLHRRRGPAAGGTAPGRGGVRVPPDRDLQRLGGRAADPAVRPGRLHVNADWFILEPVDADGAPVPDGRSRTRCWSPTWRTGCSR